MAEFGFLFAAAGQRQVGPASCASLAEGWRSALWTCLPLLLVGWVSVSLLAAMGCRPLLVSVSLLAAMALSLLRPWQWCKRLVEVCEWQLAAGKRAMCRMD